MNPVKLTKTLEELAQLYVTVEKKDKSLCEYIDLSAQGLIEKTNTKNPKAFYFRYMEYKSVCKYCKD